MKKGYLGIAALIVTNTVVAQPSKPNVILILTDDQGYGDFSCTGNQFVRTPNMDSLKKKGVSFSNFHVSSVSAPTRAALMTGRYCYRTGVTGINKSKVNMYEDEKTIAEYMKEAGYHTGLFGKWHLGYNYPMRPIDQGFDEYYTWEEMQFYRTNPIMEENGTNVLHKGEFLTDVIFQKANQYLEKQATQKEPFFMYLATYLPHTHTDGTQVPEQYFKRFDKYPELSWHTRQTYAMVEKVDEQLGTLLSNIDKLGLNKNTLIIFGTDNGPAACYPGKNRSCENRFNANLRGMKGDVYEGGIKTPWFFVWKDKLTEGKVINRFSAHVDILPTLCELIGAAPIPEKRLDGNSLCPVLFGHDKPIKETRYFYHMYRQDMNILPNEWKQSCYIEGNYKLVEGRELYNILVDPYEQEDLAIKAPMQLEFMRKKSQDYIREQLAERNGKYQPNVIGSDKQDIINLSVHDKNR